MSGRKRRALQLEEIRDLSLTDEVVEPGSRAIEEDSTDIR